jgi:hypothetical protein
MDITGKLFSVFININKDCLIPALKKSKIRLWRDDLIVDA